MFYPSNQLLHSCFEYIEHCFFGLLLLFLSTHSYAEFPNTTIVSHSNVFQPQVPLRLPCYDFTWVANTAVPKHLHRIVLTYVRTDNDLDGNRSRNANSPSVTGGVYKTRLPIHRSVLIYDYSQFLLHVFTFQKTIRTTDAFLSLAHARAIASLCMHHCSTCIAQSIKAIMT